jgi:hypothetical protein
LWTALWPDGIVIFKPGSAGEIRDDGSLAMKFPWWRRARGPLEVEGHRLDRDSEPLGSIIPEGFGESGFQASELVFPAAGCWQVIRRAGAGELTFVVLVKVET